MSYGLGIALRPSDRLTFDLDVYRTEWGDYVLHDADGYELNPITGKLRKDSAVSATTQVRIGGEYLIIGESTVVPIRAGVFYDPEPADGSPDDFYGFSIGSGIAYKSVVYDVAYQYRFGRDVRTATVGNADSSQNVKQHTIYMSVIYHF
jgi:long-subunit fatty acid transport protein